MEMYKELSDNERFQKMREWINEIRIEDPPFTMDKLLLRIAYQRKLDELEAKTRCGDKKAEAELFARRIYGEVL